ncbi:F-box associated interaction domain [Sesbania bispinosa]|nr:F-box associated interaction domain [Sesbania bispinosa]
MVLSQNDFFDIFSWLPAKAIYRFKSINKPFYNFSKEAYFATKQSQNSLAKDDTSFFIQPHMFQRYDTRVELHSLPREEASSGVSNDVLKFLSNSARVLASSNGLILCRTTSKDLDELFICNPITKSHLSIPNYPKQSSFQENLDNNDLNIVFECYHDLDDFSIFLFENPIHWSSFYKCKVYHAKEGVWKTMERSFSTGNRSMKFNMPVHYNGALHFISDSYPYINRLSSDFRPYIKSYNLKSGMSTKLTLPAEARRGSHDKSCNTGIFKWCKVSSLLSQSICLVRLKKLVFSIWVLIDYESRSWERILKVRVKAMGLMEKYPKVTGFTVMNGDLLIFATEEKVYNYGLSELRYMRLEEICEHGCGTIVYFTPYSNTLRPCGNVAATLPC